METASFSGDTTIIDPSGDVLLAVSDEAYGPSVNTFRVSCARLRDSSRYFNILLDPLKFYEGVTLGSKLKELVENNTDLKNVSLSQLPTIPIKAIGQIGKVSGIRGLIRDFLLILHGDTSNTLTSKIPLSNLANLTIVGDHFDALQTLKTHAHKNGLFTRVSRRDSTPRKPPGPVLWNNSTEESTRMRVMVGMLLDHQPWVQETENLIFRGSKMWSDPPESNPEPALWWNLPHGLEGESRMDFINVILYLSSTSFANNFQRLAKPKALASGRSLETYNCYNLLN
jgi:hypothetical protein